MDDGKMYPDKGSKDGKKMEELGVGKTGRSRKS